MCTGFLGALLSVGFLESRRVILAGPAAAVDDPESARPNRLVESLPSRRHKSAPRDDIPGEDEPRGGYTKRVV